LAAGRSQEVMNEPVHFEIREDYAIFRPAGEVSLERAVQLVTSALVLAREQQIKKLLVVATGLTGFESPSLSSRYFFIQEWARAAQGSVSVAMVVQPELIDPQKFGVTVGENAGLRSEVFASEQEALVWLQNLR
jgi:hypothetical protein